MSVKKPSMEIVCVNDNVKTDASRPANYKPNIWNYESLLLSLSSKYGEEKYRRDAETLRMEVVVMLGAVDQDPLNKLELIDGIKELALSYYFEEEIAEAMNGIIALLKSNICSGQNHELLRQYGYNYFQDALIHNQVDEEERSLQEGHVQITKLSEVFEACHLAMEGECLLDREKKITATNGRHLISSNDDPKHANYEINTLSSKCSLHWGVIWFNVKKHIHSKNYPVLLPLARLNFNIVQFQHQNDLKQILRWWMNLGLLEVLEFTRDRVVESFLWAVGVAYEPYHGSLRKLLTKVIMFILILDDVYDIYGSIQELEQFTIAVERWDPREIDGLPVAMRRCFWALYDTVNEIDIEIQKEKNWNSALPHMRKVWTDFCKAMLVEARWHQRGCTPSLQEYLDNGWTSSSGPVLSLYVLFGVGQDLTETINIFNSNQDIIRHASLIIRLRNDEATSQAEMERGDAPSSILCYMREAKVEEFEARDYIRETVTCTWKKMNGIFINSPGPQQPIINYILNIARVANFIYQNGDGFGVQDRETRQQVLSCLLEPLLLA